MIVSMTNGEIKFRVWNGELKRMGYSDDSSFKTPGWWGIVLFTDDGINPKYGEILMQFTGFKDKNGKEIYEGDIVKDCSDSDLSFVVKWDEESGGYWMPKEFDEEYAYPISSVTLEVIGNIYENPPAKKNKKRT